MPITSKRTGTNMANSTYRHDVIGMLFLFVWTQQTGGGARQGAYTHVYLYNNAILYTILML